MKNKDFNSIHFSDFIKRPNKLDYGYEERDMSGMHEAGFSIKDGELYYNKEMERFKSQLPDFIVDNNNNFLEILRYQKNGISNMAKLSQDLSEYICEGSGLKNIAVISMKSNGISPYKEFANYRIGAPIRLHFIYAEAISPLNNTFVLSEENSRELEEKYFSAISEYAVGMGITSMTTESGEKYTLRRKLYEKRSIEVDDVYIENSRKWNRVRTRARVCQNRIIEAYPVLKKGKSIIYTKI